MFQPELEFETVFPTALEAYRSADEIGAEHGRRTLVLANAGPDGRTSWSVYSYEPPPPVRHASRTLTPVYRPDLEPTQSWQVTFPEPRPSHPAQAFSLARAFVR